MYASFDSTAPQPTPVTGWYDDMTPACKLVPAANLLQLTQAQWDNRLNTPCVQNGALVAAPAPSSAQLVSDSRNAAYSAIDSQAGATRAKYITIVPGQSETYMSKATDAANYKAAGYPFASLASYVWVQAEAVAINGASPTSAQVKAAADSILAAQAAWIALGASIEQARRAGAVAVAAASTVAAIQAAQAAAVASLQAM